MWSEQQLTPIENNKSSFEVTFDEIKNLTFNEQYYLTDFDKNERTTEINKSLLTLTDRQQKIIERRFYENETRESIAKDLGISIPRVMQIEENALRTLRHPTRSDNLKIYLKD